jgi:hypothetical protein
MIAVLQGLLLSVGGLLAPFYVPFFLLARHVPWWMVTPDDPVSPFGKYEAGVVAVYQRWGKFVGDWYWLGLRNALYGLAYRWKPDFLKGLPFPYAQLRMTYLDRRFYRLIRVDRADFELTLKLGPIVAILGRRLSPIWDNVPGQIPRPINMDARPIFSMRRARDG